MDNGGWCILFFSSNHVWTIALFVTYISREEKKIKCGANKYREQFPPPFILHTFSSSIARHALANAQNGQLYCNSDYHTGRRRLLEYRSTQSWRFRRAAEMSSLDGKGEWSSDYVLVKWKMVVIGQRRRR
jgi:hypothetical protein